MIVLPDDRMSVNFVNTEWVDNLALSGNARKKLMCNSNKSVFFFQILISL